MRLLVFGDSIGQGFFDQSGGWVQRLANDYHKRYLASLLSNGDFDLEVFNLGISGDTTERVSKRLEPESEARRWQDDPMIIALAVGFNDARQLNNRVVMDVYDFQRLYDRLLDQATSIADYVLCVGLSAVDESQTDPWPHSSTHYQWSNNRINLFEDTIKQSAFRRKLPFVPIHDKFLAELEAGRELLADGLHPNDAGHHLMAELIKPWIDKLTIGK